MKSLIVINNTKLKFDPKFGDRTVTIVAPQIIAGSGRATVNGSKVCIKGDEGKVRLAASYTTATHTTPGTGTVSITRLAASQLASSCTSGAALITKGDAGAQFEALFTVMTPAIKPGVPPEPDAPTSSAGKGQFDDTQQNFASAGSP